MQTAKIDDSDLVAVEVYVIIGVGAVFALNGGIYLGIVKNGKELYGLTSMTIAASHWL
jgi:hypothetical protein